MKLSLICLIITAVILQSRAYGNDAIDTLRSELALIGSQVEDLRVGLLSPEVRSLAPSDAGIALLRLDALEARLRSTVGRVEALEFNLQILSEDANNRIQEFKLKLAAFENHKSLGSSEYAAELKRSQKNENRFIDVSNETLAFDKALLSFNSKDFETARNYLNSFHELYPQSINVAEAHYWLGRTKFELSDPKGSANAFLEAFSLSPNGIFAWKSLLGLAVALGKLGQNEQGCLTLKELKSRFPKEVGANLDEILVAEEQMKCSA